MNIENIFQYYFAGYVKKVVWLDEDCDNYFKDKMRITLEIVPTTTTKLGSSRE